jgi:PAS domain S-box-containing protein
MALLPTRLRTVGRPPEWLSVLVALGTVAAFVVAYPVSPAPLLDVVAEAAFLWLALVVLYPVHRLEVGLLEWGAQLFVLSRLVGLLDDLFVGAGPLVEPFLGGLLTLGSLAVISVGVYALVRQRDERVEVLEERTAELGRKNQVIEQAPIGITVADMTKEDDPLVEINQAFSRLTGYGVEETLGENCRFLQGEDTDPEKVARMREAIEANESVQVTLRNYRKDGTMFWNEVTLSPLHDGEGEPRYYVGFQQDATARKEYELELEEQRDDLELLNEMVRHDIRNDLQLVRGYAELLKGQVEEEGTDHLDTVLEASSDAVALTRSAGELSETMLTAEPAVRAVPLTPTLQESVASLRESYPDAVVEVVEPLPDVSVRADEMLDSVFRNLLRNAVQHNDKAVPEVTVTAEREADRVEIRIADNGPGIPDDQKPTVFGKGEKGLESEGTGIGTYLVKTLVSRYGGDVWIEDNEPEGAVFVVSLPAAE